MDLRTAVEGDLKFQNARPRGRAAESDIGASGIVRGRAGGVDWQG
jgi:hypothetical protein